MSVVLCVASLTFTPGCKSLDRGPTKTSLAIVFLFDLSSSTQDKTVREDYLRDFGSVLNAFYDEKEKRVVFDGKTVIAGDRITANSQATASLPIDETIPAYNAFSSNPSLYRRKLLESSAALTKKASEIVSDPRPIDFTDLLSSFQLASKIFNGERCKEAPAKYLIIFSDMIEESRRYNFTRDPLSGKRIEQIIRNEKAAGLLPSLPGVKVWVAGAARDMKQGLPPEKIASIQEFWIRYFTAAGAALTSERYGSRLMNFALPEKR